MSLRAKISLVILFEILATISIVGILAFRQSKNEIESLARDLLQARTEYAYTLCEMYDDMHGHPIDQLYERIRRVRIADGGYIAVLDFAEGHRGELIIHPTDVGKNLNIPSFAHIQKILRQIEESGAKDGEANFISYRQGTDALGRQGEAKIGYYKYFAPWQWVLLSTGYEKDVYSATNIVRRRVLEAILLMGVVALVLVNLTLVQIFRPLRELIAATKQVAAGNLDVSLQARSDDEIGGLSRHFGRMLAGLKENTRVWQELEIARRLQREMLPAENPDLPGVQIDAISRPAAEVGGDFYDFVPLDENRFAIIVGDVSGKGISGAIVMSSALSALRFALDETQRTDQVLRLANRRLVRDIQNHMFVAVFLAIFDRRQRTLSYTNAGQTMPILLREGRVDFLAQSEADRFPLGIRPEVNYKEESVSLRQNDMLVFYTDGIVDIMNGTHEPYGFDRFRASILRNAGLEMLEMQRGLLEDARRYGQANGHADDITIVLMKVC